MYLGRAQSGLKSGDPEKPNVGILQVYRDLACVRERQGRYDEADSLWHSAISLGDIILKSCGSNGGTGEEALLGPRTHFGYFEFLCRIGRDREALATGEAFLDKYCGGSTFRDFTILCLTKLKVIAESSKMHELVARYEYQLKVLN
jgi:hypothetical protein